MKNKIFFVFLIFGIILLCLSFVYAQDSENSSECWMLGRYLNHTAWDGVSYSTIFGLNSANFTTGGNVYYPVVANGYVYIGSSKVYQLNASNVGLQIANFTVGNAIYSSPAVANGYVYVGSSDNKVYQLNAVM